jgi:hypothetical protein
MKNTTILFLIFFTASCSKDFLDQATPHIVAPDNLYVSEEGFDAGLNGLYALARAERGGVPTSPSSLGQGNNLTAAMMMGGTDIIYGNRAWPDERFLNNWQEEIIGSGAQTYFTRTWNWLYQTINSANTIITRGENSSGDLDISTEKLNRILAEAKTIRAWAYRHLTFLFGDVPLVLEESAGENVRTDWERTPIQEVREQIKNDLAFAVQYLLDDHVNDGQLIKAVAQHYLMEQMLIDNNYGEAINLGLAAINGPKSLVTQRYGVKSGEPGTPYSDMFLDGNSNPSEGNTEALWVFQYEYETEGGEGSNIMRRWFMSEYSSTSGGAKGLTITVDRGGRGNTRLGATSFMLGLYESDDDGNILDDRGGEFAWRRYFTVQDFDRSSAGPVGSKLYLNAGPDDPQGDRFRVYTRKWDWAIDLNPSVARSYNDQVYLRLADTYLLLAEAYHKSGDNSSAAQYINELRTRANASLITAGDVTLDFILDERARELFSESQRRYTLLRNNKWMERTMMHNVATSGKITNRDRLYPIPQSFIDANLDLPIENNPGY